MLIHISRTSSCSLILRSSLAQAKTGTGKTLAFLVPSMQNILNDPSFEKVTRDSRRADASDIRALIISPTRELAEQIAAEAKRVAGGTGLQVQTAVGGTSKASGLRRIQDMGCHLLIGTPGRIRDIFSDPRSGVSAPKLNTLILDEADRLLDQGFSEEIKAIQDLLPDPMKVDRQTLMFSATVPKEVMQMVRRTMKPDFKFVKTVRDDEVPTHLKVPQRTVFVRGYENALPAILELVKNYRIKQQEDASLRPFKAIVYFNSTSEVRLAAQVFSNLKSDPEDGRSRSPLGRMRILEIHARLTQAQRTFSSSTFRKTPEGILFSSDVTARGMDFPDVTHVIQVGVPTTRETYIHRIGRTARANKTGEGWLFIHDGENGAYEQKLRGLPLAEDSTSLPTAMANMAEGMETASPATALTIEQIKAAMEEVSSEIRATSYRSQLGVLTNSFSSRHQAVRVLNDLAVHGYGLPEPPRVRFAVARNIGIDRIPGLNLETSAAGPAGGKRRNQPYDRFADRSGRSSSGYHRSPQSRHLNMDRDSERRPYNRRSNSRDQFDRYGF